MGGNQVLLNGNGHILKLASGAAISAAAANAWGDGAGFLQFMRRAGFNANNPAAGYRAGSWLAGQTGFAGIRLDAGGGNYNYGWIRMRVDDQPGGNALNRLTILDYGYEEFLNTPIVAGDMTPAAPVPEPGTALFALAAAGAAALRRQRRAA